MARKLDYFGPDAAAFLAKEPNLDVPVRTLKEIEPGIFSHDGVQVCFVQLCACMHALQHLQYRHLLQTVGLWWWLRVLAR